VDTHDSGNSVSVHAPDHHHERTCELRPCHDEVVEKVFVKESKRDDFSDAANLSSHLPAVVWPYVAKSGSIDQKLAASPPTVPPASRTSRAPPVFLQSA
jgi:hypothetical protein